MKLREDEKRRWLLKTLQHAFFLMANPKHFWADHSRQELRRLAR